MDNKIKSSWLDYTLIRKSIRNIRIRVTGASEVVVSAPRHTALSRIDGFIGDNIEKILSNLDNINSKRLRYYPARYATGETFWHLGEEAVLKVVTSARPRAVYSDGTLVLHVPGHYSLTQIKTLFMRWSKKTADAIFRERLGILLPAFTSSEFSITAKNMLTRWGSINPARRTISLSVHLLRCELQLIDYIITHELCHLKHMDHSKAFYRELEIRFPHRKLIDKKLEAYGLVDYN